MKYVTFLLTVLTSVTIQSQITTVTVGGNPLCGTSTNGSSMARYNGALGTKSWNAILYTASDIGISESGTITDIAFIADCKSSACSYDTASGQVVYMALTNASSFTSTNRPDLNTMTEVYSGDVTWVRGTGSPYEWTTITLDNAFNYDGSSNIIIYYENNFTAELGGFFGCGASPNYMVNNLGANRVIYANSYNGMPPATGFFNNQTPLLQLIINTETLSINNSKDNKLSASYFIRDKQLVVTGTLDYNLKLYNLKGQLILNSQQRNSIFNLPNTITSGIYIIEINSNKGQLRKKIVIQ